MKTTHQLAKELMALPDVPVVVEYWVYFSGSEPTAEITDYDPNTQTS